MVYIVIKYVTSETRRIDVNAEEREYRQSERSLWMRRNEAGGDFEGPRPKLKYQAVRLESTFSNRNTPSSIEGGLGSTEWVIKHPQCFRCQYEVNTSQIMASNFLPS